MLVPLKAHFLTAFNSIPPLHHRCSALRKSASMAISTAVQVKDKIELTAKEKKIFTALLDVNRHFNLQTQLRVAGGWVRDKLMGKQCYDIDIALDNMLGRQFCEKVKEFMQISGEEQEDFAIIQCNPDQSKHLEAARMRIHDMWIDFVNLRSESYSDNSRIPTMEFGTAEEDAFRRDLTINSLFYNINANLVEDLTKRGISDLKSGFIVTPLPPKETFLDDPLRVLRAIRFGARFGFVLDEKLRSAASDEEVRIALKNKVSRERIGHEIELMLSGNNPNKAMENLCSFHLFWVVFALPQGVEPPISEESDRLCAGCMHVTWGIIQQVGVSKFSDEHRRLSLFAALFLPLRNTICLERKGKKMSVSNFLFRNSLKIKVSDADGVVNLHSTVENFIKVISIMVPEQEHESLIEVEDETLCATYLTKRRIFAGLLLQNVKGFWRAALLLAILLHNTDGHVEKIVDIGKNMDKLAEQFIQTEQAILDLGLDGIWNVAPLLDGHTIMHELQLKPGTHVRDWKTRVFKWQLAHPEGTSEECLEWIRQSSVKHARLS